jgi:hypothetical protein
MGVSTVDRARIGDYNIHRRPTLKLISIAIITLTGVARSNFPSRILSRLTRLDRMRDSSALEYFAAIPQALLVRRARSLLAPNLEGLLGIGQLHSGMSSRNPQSYHSQCHRSDSITLDEGSCGRIVSRFDSGNDITQPMEGAEHLSMGYAGLEVISPCR